MKNIEILMNDLCGRLYPLKRFKRRRFLTYSAAIPEGTLNLKAAIDGLEVVRPARHDFTDTIKLAVIEQLASPPVHLLLGWKYEHIAFVIFPGAVHCKYFLKPRSCCPVKNGARVAPVVTLDVTAMGK